MMLLLLIFTFLRSTNIISVECTDKIYLVQIDSSKNVRYRSFTSVQNSILDNQSRTIKEMYVNNNRKCLGECLDEENCQSYNIGPVTTSKLRLCKLLNSSVYEHRSMIADSPGWTHISKMDEYCEKCRNKQACVPANKDAPARCVCASPYIGEFCELKGPFCAPIHPFAFQCGGKCCMYDKDCHQKPIKHDSMCCLGDAFAPCPTGTCQDSYLRSPECPSTHPFAYLDGGYCCAYNKDMHGVPLSRESDNCWQHTFHACYDGNGVHVNTCRDRISRDI